MYETGGDLCPVKSYQLYLMKLHPLQPRLFQQPRRKATPDSPMWYGKAPIGEKALQQMMANISGIYETDHLNTTKNITNALFLGEHQTHWLYFNSYCNTIEFLAIKIQLKIINLNELAIYVEGSI